MPTTSNKIENFNLHFALDTNSYHLATNSLVEHLRLEQGLTETKILKIQLGKENPKNKNYGELEKTYENILNNYTNEDIFAFLNSIAIVIENFNGKIKQKSQIQG